MTVLHKTDAAGQGCDAPERVKTLIRIDDALRQIAERVDAINGTEHLPLPQARGRILAEQVRASDMAPPFDSAAMDGFAVACTTLTGAGPWTLPVVDRVPAGQVGKRGVSGAAAVRIFTGAPVPVGADAVIMQENVRQLRRRIVIDQRPTPGTNIRHAGEDLMTGQSVLQVGQRLTPRAIAACAAAGCSTVTVRRRLRVALLITGDEVQKAGEGRSAAGIWDVNTPMLSAELDRPEIDLTYLRWGGDQRGDLIRHFSQMAKTVDLLITTGGLSVGDEDHVRPALQALGGQIDFSGVAIKPGKPVSFGRLGTTRWLGLPGNPGAAFVAWHLFGSPLLRGLSGQRAPLQGRRHVVLGQSLRHTGGRCELRPARIVNVDGVGREIVHSDSATFSARVGKLHDADGLLFLPADAGDLAKGALIKLQPFCDT